MYIVIFTLKKKKNPHHIILPSPLWNCIPKKEAICISVGTQSFPEITLHKAGQRYYYRLKENAIYPPP